jgi:hypothetical protein
MKAVQAADRGGYDALRLVLPLIAGGQITPPRAVAEPEEALHHALGVKFGQDARLLGPVGLELVEVRDGSRRVHVHE